MVLNCLWNFNRGVCATCIWNAFKTATIIIIINVSTQYGRVMHMRYEIGHHFFRKCSSPSHDIDLHWHVVNWGITCIEISMNIWRIFILKFKSKISSPKCQPFCLSLNILSRIADNVFVVSQRLLVFGTDSQSHNLEAGGIKTQNITGMKTSSLHGSELLYCWHSILGHSEP